MSDEQRYWMNLEELDAPADGAAPERPERGDEFAEELPVGEGADPERSRLDRRDFMKLMGLSAGLVAAAGCRRAPVRHVIPYLVAPEEIVPGVATWYASTCAGCAASCGTLLKTRDGRPIKVEGNPAQPVSQGGLCAVGHASLLSLYDARRAQAPVLAGAPATWAATDAAVIAGLRSAGDKLRLVTPAVNGPSAEAAIATFLAAFPGARRVIDDPPGHEALARAHARTHGAHLIPAYHLERARVVVSFAADFLGTWLDPVGFSKGWSSARGGASFRHYQLEPTMTLTGAAADQRWTVRASDLPGAISALARALGLDTPAPAGNVPRPERIALLAQELRAAGRQGLVVSGSDDEHAQALVAAINQSLGAYGSTLSLSEAAPRAEGASMGALAAELESGAATAVVLVGANPVYSHPRGAELGKLLAQAFTVQVADRVDETGAVARMVAAAADPLEAWGDAEPRRGVIAIRQPGVLPLGDTRPAWASLLTWAGAAAPWDDHVRERWRREVHPRAATPSALAFDDFWDAALRAGHTQVTTSEGERAWVTAMGALAAPVGTPSAEGELELVIHESVALRDGRLANNAWLQELPDPISKLTWANVAALAPDTARKLGLSDGDRVAVEVDGSSIELPVLVQPGVHASAVGVLTGYGRTAAGPVGDRVGANVWPLAHESGGVTRTRAGVRLRKLGGSIKLARTQPHASMEGRPLVRETAPGQPLPSQGKHHLSMWPGHKYPGHKWGMVIDLAKCTGCSACVVSCQAENNVPSVGALEVSRQREMHWLRIDRYYAGDPAEPAVVQQPLMCQHCDNAPCETVCPVLATVHSNEGLNQQVYNRCVGTRYCANNCPYKVRRFNWFDYPHSDPLANLVLNPDVVVRSRGVMEKCSLCVQRIQYAKGEARKEGRDYADGDAKTACQQSCPADAIVFGDLHDPESRVARLITDGRAYRLLEEVGVEPAVRYLAKVRNPGGAP